MQKFDYTLFADYFQFYLQDESAKGDLSDSWTQEAVDRLLAVAPGIIGVGTVRNMNVPVVVEIADSEPDANLSAWDHVNECTLEVPSGRVVIAGCTDIAITLGPTSGRGNDVVRARFDPMHQCCIPLSGHPSARTSAATCTGPSEHA